MKNLGRVMGLLVMGWLMSGESLMAADREVVSLTWPEFQREMAARELSNSMRVFLVDGSDVKAEIVRVEDDGLAVLRGRSEEKIARAQIRRVQVQGRVGRRGLMGGLIGAGAGTAVTVGTWAYYQSRDRETGFYNTAATAAVAIPSGAVAGYLIGRFTSKLGPEFVIVDGR